MTATATPTPDEPEGCARAWWVDLLHLGVLAAFAVAQPLYAVFRESPEFFVSRRVRPGELVLFAALLVLVPWGLAAAVEAVAGLAGARWRRRTHLGVVAVFLVLTALYLLGRVWKAPPPVALLVAVLAAAALSLLYARGDWFGQLLTIGAPVPLLFAAIFLFTPPVSRLVVHGYAPAAPPGQVNSSAPVVFVVFDEFPEFALLDPTGSAINAQRFPNLASLAARSTWFRNTASVHPLTESAVPAILSGKEPDDSALPDLSSYPNNLFTLLASAYRMHVVEPITHLCPDQVCLAAAPDQPAPARPASSRVLALAGVSRSLYARMLLPGRYREFTAGSADPFGEFLATQGGDVIPPAAPTLAPQGSAPTDTKAFESRAVAELLSDRNQRFRAFLNQIDAGPRVLHFIHLPFPHTPYQYLPSGRRYNDIPLPGVDDGVWRTDAGPQSQIAQQRLLLQLGDLDRLIGQLTARLQALGTFDESLIVITADHGISFQPGQPVRLPSEANKYDLAMVPLLIKAPHQAEGSVNDIWMQTTDILPTVAGLLGTTLPFPVDGHDVLAPGAPPRTGLHFDNHPGGGTLNLEDPAGARMRQSARLGELFGDGSSPDDRFAFAPHGDLVGRPVAQLPADSAPDLSASLDDASRYASVDLAGGSVPAYVRGSLQGSVDADTFVAVAVNGTIGAVAPVYDLDGGGARFGVVVPDGLLVQGTNTITLLAVRGSGPQVQIQTLPVGP